METSRVEAFSDGVFAIAVTLLVLDLHVPNTGGGPPSLAHQLRLEWPGYVGYVVSFATIGIMWINHHALMRHFDRTDRPFLLINTGFLMLVAFVPFPTGVVASSLGTGRNVGDVRTAALLYGGTMVVMALMFNAVWHYGRLRLLRPDAVPLEVSGITRSYMFGPLMYLAATLAAFLNPYLSLALYVAIAVLYAISASSFGQAEQAT